MSRENVDGGTREGENVETLHRALDAFNRGDRSAWLAECGPDFETVPSEDWPEFDTIRGAEAAWDFYVEANEPWEGGPYEYLETIDGGADRVVARLRRQMRGKASGVDVEYSYWVVATFRDGKARRIQWFIERADALEAAGLSDSR
jgi:ketosteroid isomerase-like protein